MSATATRGREPAANRARRRPVQDPRRDLAGDLATQRLLKRYHRTGDPQALDQLVKRFLPLARQLARRYYGGGEPLDDLVQVASLGLVKALNRFDDSRGTSFSSYAVPTITGEIKRYFRDSVWAVHLPRESQERALAVNRAVRELSETTGREPSVRDLSERLKIDEQQVRDGLEAYAAFDAMSLDARMPSRDDPDGQPRAETIGRVDDGFELTDDRLTVAAAVRALPAEDRRMLRMRFIEARTQADIATQIGVSQMQVSRILGRITRRLQDTVERQMALAG